MSNFTHVAAAIAQNADAPAFDYSAIKSAIISGDLGEHANTVWELMDHARDLEAKLAAATRPAPAPVKRASSRGASGVGARNAARGSLTTDENVPMPATEAGPFGE